MRIDAGFFKLVSLIACVVDIVGEKNGKKGIQIKDEYRETNRKIKEQLDDLPYHAKMVLAVVLVLVVINIIFYYCNTGFMKKWFIDITSFLTLLYSVFIIILGIKNESIQTA